MNIVFLGTPQFAVPSLNVLLEKSHEQRCEKHSEAFHKECLDDCNEEHNEKHFKVCSEEHYGDRHENFTLSCVITRPDAIRKRGKELTPSPVKEVALKHHIPLIETTRITQEVLEQVQRLEPDIAIVVAFGALLPQEFLAIPKKGVINVHASLLPRWRGAAPIERAILAGDQKTGVSIMRVTKALDAGDYCAQKDVVIAEKSAAELTDELAHLGARLLVEALGDISDGSVRWTQQDEKNVTLAPKINKEEMRLSPSKTCDENLRLIQASSRKAPARLKLSNGKMLRIVQARPVHNVMENASHVAQAEDPKDITAIAAGNVTSCSGRLLFGVRDGAFEALRLIPEGKKEMSGADFSRGFSKDVRVQWS